MELKIKNAICSGTIEKVSSKTGRPYQMTKFICLDDGARSLMVFGNLGLPRLDTPRDYVIEGDCESFSGSAVAGK